ncbi:unnamed protein product [Sphagnum troendelagicum]|uniref:Uncharacterized protein n=1 Tax=Sphagnum troendelagicum TaxID=128251 RepID=A0ABP0UP96_9BRYO
MEKKSFSPPPPNLKGIKARHHGPSHWPKFYYPSGFDGPAGTLPCPARPPSQPVSPSPVPSTHRTYRDSPMPSPALLATVTTSQPLFRFWRAGPGRSSVTNPNSVRDTIFNFRFLTLLAIGGSLAGSLLCFLKGCGYVFESFNVHRFATGQILLKLVEAVDVYLFGTVLLIFGMGVYGLFISNVATDTAACDDRALQNTSLFGLFLLKRRPLWMRIGSLDELKTKLGHVIVMILLVKMYEKSKVVVITTSVDLLGYAISIFMSSTSLYVLHRLHHS